MKTPLIIAVLVFFAAFPSFGAAGASGKISFDKENHDFGKVLYGKKVGHTFVVSNLGDGPLQITKVDVDCGCAKAIKGDPEIAPKGKSEIAVEFDTEGQRSGKKEKSVYVHSSDPTRPMVKLSLVSEVVRELEVDPPTFAKKLPSFQETLSIPLKITNASDRQRTITAIRATEKNVSASLESEKLALAPQTTVPFNVILRLKPQSQGHLYLGKILMETDHPQEKEIDIRFLVQILQP
ncbi:MAG: DUF1573 domain-containing protein [Desulfomonile tiedjei]|uniref:DUF1573 domain-containing protein n=1 Tax=Desulfomonile tiedjei TaxID=2358 RepID=A0A9D6V1J8_9BACT|nr:DUF1573 domain-containing protein [Desulfomonile tiedjei]